MIPVVEISGCKVSENCYNRGEFSWDVATLISYCKEKNYPVFDLPLAAIPMSGMPLTITTYKQFIQHCKRVHDADLEYPIILDDNGSVADGYHRIAKAVLRGDVTIKAIRILEMPAESGKIEK